MVYRIKFGLRRIQFDFYKFVKSYLQEVTENNYSMSVTFGFLRSGTHDTDVQTISNTVFDL